MLLDDIARTSEAVAGTSSRTAKVDALASCLRGLRAGRGADRGRLPVRRPPACADRRRLGRAPRPPAPSSGRRRSSSLEVDAALTEIGAASRAGLAGGTSERARRALLPRDGAGAALPPRAPHGELRQGALESVVADAVARAADVAPAEVRRALMLAGDLGAVATAALADGRAGLARFRLELLRPLQPMLAQTAESPREAIERARRGRRGVEARRRADPGAPRRRGGPRVHAQPRGHHRPRARGRRGRPRAARSRRSSSTARRSRSSRTGGRILPGDDEPVRQQARRRRAPLAGAAVAVVLRLPPRRRGGPSRPAARRAPRRARSTRVPRARCATGASRPTTPRRPSAFLEDALAHGHEGVMVKAVDAPYEAGRRGAAG